jgi:integrator complex subunit 1
LFGYLPLSFCFQLNAHIENVTAIARRIPVASVANHMYAILLGEVVKHSDSASLLDLDRIKMLVAVHREISSHVSYDAMAAALLTLLVSHQPNGNLSAALSRAERGSLVKKLRRIIRAVAFELGPSFDGCMLVEALLSLDVSTDSWSTRDEEDKARLMYQCVTVSVSPFLKDYAANKMSVSAKSSVRELLKKARKSLLAWCCTEYGPRFAARTNGKSSKPKLEELSEACATDFNSALGPSTAEEIPSWLETMRCVLFMEDPYSSRMKELLAPGEFAAAQDADWDEELTRISLCCEFGADLSDELLWVVLKSASLSHGGIDSQMAVQLLEHLFLCCGRTRSGTLEVSDPNLVWEFYNLVHFDPPKHFVDDDSLSDDSDNFPGEHLSNGSKMHDIPRLARPGMWWRVTMLALVMCGSSKESIGSTAWNEHPTLRALIKMITSTRYRFPTVDCDEQARAEMKKAEQNARDEESQIAELLFLPKRPEKKKEQKKAGARVSRRLQKKQQEKEAAKELAETNRRKKLLRVAQKSIMLWDPDGPARKPPKESVDLLLSIEERFDLSNIFQRSTTPDFLLMTIGQTTRGAIERAYDWLIPIISALPDAIARLPSSASCFLLLKAYGTDGEERKQLKQLSAPLLSHVKESLNGDYGEQDSIKAFDLLMSDVASHKPALRRCARKVLQDALLRPEGKTSWMLSILLLDHAKSLVNHAVKHMATAATFERGRVLRSLLMALEQHIQFAEKHDVKVEWRFPELLINLMSRRPNVCAEAMDAFSDLLSMAVRVLHSEFLRYAQGPGGEIARNGEPVVVMKTYGTTSDEATTVTLPLSLLQSVSVVLSTWKEQESGLDQQATSSVDYLANVLLCSIDCSVANNELGLASAKIQDGEGVAASVEFWIMLAKARSDSMARRAALSAPANVLPRLLLSSGLPRASLLTMIDRLGRLGDSVEDKDEAFLALLVPSASSDWDIGRVGSRHEISRKLLGRISAYMRLNNVTFGEKDSEVSATFLAWLSRECRAHKDRKPKKTKQKKPGASVADSLSSLAAASSVLSTLEQGAVSPVSDFTMGRWGGSMDELKRYEESSRITPADDMGSDSAKAFITSCLSDNQFVALDEWLGSFFANHGIDVSKSESAKDHDFVDLSAELLRGYKSLEHPLDGTTRIIFKWVPRISQCKGNPDLWQIMFCRSLEKAQSSFSCQLLTKCLASWTEQHVNSCRDWILGMADNNEDDYDCDLFATFIVSTSRQLSSQVDRFSETSPLSIESDWANSRPFVISCTKIAMRCLKQCPADSKETVSRRNGLPPGLTLILLVARRGKKQLQCVTEGILQELSASEGEDEDIHKIFGGIFLRLYLSFPQWMDLGSPVVRTALMQASEAFSSHWTDWRSDFDDKLDDMFDAVISGELRLTKPLTEMARKHPLLLLRKLQAWSRSLESDATCNGRESNGVISGQHLSGPRTAKLCGKIVRVTIRHWGYSFTEPVWIALLDIISAIPREVLFTCGPKLGLLDFLAVYLQLMSVQIQLLSANEAARLKDKLAEFFGAFQEHSPKGWKSWLGSKIGETEVRHMLMVCDYITPQQAIESLKDA